MNLYMKNTAGANLYTQLIEKKTTDFSATLGKINGLLPAILRAEKMASTLYEAGLIAGAHADKDCYPYLIVSVPIEQLDGGRYVTKYIAKALARQIIEDKGTPDAYLVLPEANETGVCSLRLMVQAI